MEKSRGSFNPRGLTGFLKREPVLCVAAVCALVSAVLVLPDRAYLTYIDLRVLCLLFCLMLVVAGVEDCGLFGVLAQKLLAGQKRFRMLSLVLVLLPFFSSMLITNDVALITFVPFTILVLDLIGRKGELIYIVALQTAAANLGSMAMPVGNPQNLYLCSRYGISMGDFFAAMLPLTLVSLAGLSAAALLVSRETIQVRFQEEQRLRRPGQLRWMAALFLLCLLTVFHVLPYGLVFALTLGTALIWARPLLRRVDYGLLVTFVCFFVFAGNLGRMEPVRQALAALLEKNAVLTSALASQVVSNVPAAVLLSGFTEDWRGLLVGTNVGGLGTLIASLASLISFKLYLGSAQSRPLRYLGVFTVINLVGLVVLGLTVWLLS